jgi:2-polyprenyl-6-hydroxyphenyl methylase/3-demethylubiquinone-9 3-methyltransferase
MDILKLRNPFTRYKLYKAKRGMSMYYDWIDWIGGYPFEVATTEQLFNFYRERGYQLEHLTTTNRSGCNELVFRKVR